MNIKIKSTDNKTKTFELPEDVTVYMSRGTDSETINFDSQYDSMSNDLTAIWEGMCNEFETAKEITLNFTFMGTDMTTIISYDRAGINCVTSYKNHVYLTSLVVVYNP